MALSEQQQQSLLGVTSFMFDFAPDQASYDRFESILDENPSFYDLGTNLAGTDTYTSQFSEGATADEKIGVILGRLGLEEGSQGYERGTDFINQRLDDGIPEGQVLMEIGEKLLQETPPEGLEDAAATLQNKIAVSQNYLESGAEGYSSDTIPDLLDGVTADQASVEAAQEKIDNLPTQSGGEGETFTLTEGADNVEGTADNDTFDGSIGQNDAGQIVNTLSSADKIDGGAGNDTLNAELSSEVNLAGETLNVQPTTESVETINVEARYSKDEVNLDAKNMTGVDTFGSEFSDGDLTIQNVNTLDGNGNARNTSDMTVRMDHTSNFDSVGDASDLTVLFDDDYLLAGEETKDSLQLRIVNNFELAENDSPLTDFASVDFTVAGENVSVDISGAETYQGVADAINAELNEQGYQGVKASVADARTSIFSDDVDSYEQGDLAGEYLPVDIVSTDGDLEPGTIKRASDVADFDGLNTWENSDSVTTNDPISVNVELEKVGRAGQGGNLEIGGKSQVNVDGQKNGIEVFNIDVLGNNAKPSSLGSIMSTNGTLKTVNIATGAEFAGADSVADLTVRGFDELVGSADKAYNPFGENVDMINAGEFEGDLTIGTANKLGSYAQNVDTLSATGGGDVEFNAAIGTNGRDDALSDYVYTTGAGEDTINVDLDSDAIDASGTGLEIKTQGGNDTVTLDGENSGASQQTMDELGNINVTTGAGDDRVNVNSDVNAYIDTGSGSDFVNINAEDSLNNGSYEAEWTFGKESASDAGTNVFQGRVLYNADLTVTFAGFESTAAIETDAQGNFIATQDEINAAIVDAIESNTDLNRMLQTSENGLNELNVQSLVNGNNELGVTINQPEVVENSATGSQVNLSGGDLNAVLQGLIDTNVAGVTSSDDASTTAGNIADGNVQADGSIDATNDYVASDNQFSDDATAGTDVNFSTVNVGTGSDDLVVLDSNEKSINVLEIDGAFGETSVVNYHDDAPDNVSSTNDVGDHALDFTAFLDNQTDASNNSNNLSEQDIAVTLNIPSPVLTPSNADNNDSTARANSVNMLQFSEDTSANSTAVDWQGLNAGNLIAALNGETGAAQLGDGSITGSTLKAGNTPNLIGNSQDHIVMIENEANVGEYKVFHLTSTTDANGNVTDSKFDANATELGTLDFGASINFNLVGAEIKTEDGPVAWEDYVQQRMAEADNAVVDNGGDQNGGVEGNTLTTTAEGFDTLVGTKVQGETTLTADNDTISISRADHVAGSYIDGGDGNDTLTFGESNDFDLTGAKLLSGIETIDAANATSLTATADQLDGVAVNGGTDLDITIKGEFDSSVDYAADLGVSSVTLDDGDDTVALSYAKAVEANDGDVTFANSDAITVEVDDVAGTDNLTKIGDTGIGGKSVTVDDTADNAYTLSAADYKTAFVTNGLSASADDTITVTAAETTTDVSATAATDVFELTATSADSFTKIDGLEADDQLNVLAADGSDAAGYTTTAQKSADAVNEAGQWHFNDSSAELTYWDASASDPGSSATVTLTGVTGVNADENGVFTAEIA